MTGSPFHRRRRAALHGFTLLEVLVVVLIIGVVLSVGVLALRPDPLADLQTEAERFAALLALASEEAIISAREIAVELGDDGYRFAVYADSGWQPLEDRLFRPRALPPDMVLEAYIEGGAYRFDAPAAGDAPPRILVLSSGEMTPFEIRLRDPRSGAGRAVRGAPDGRLEIGE